VKLVDLTNQAQSSFSLAREASILVELTALKGRFGIEGIELQLAILSWKKMDGTLS
jgi:hypothetical protein